jgi:hypothetical protein
MQRYLIRTQFLILILLVGSVTSMAQSVDFDDVYFNSTDRAAINATYEKRQALREEAKRKKEEERQEALKPITSSRDDGYSTYASRFNRFNGRCRRVTTVVSIGGGAGYYAYRPWNTPYYYQPMAYNGYNGYSNYPSYYSSYYPSYTNSGYYNSNNSNTTYYPVRTKKTNNNVIVNTPRTRTNTTVVNPNYRSRTTKTTYHNNNTTNNNTNNNTYNSNTRTRTTTNNTTTRTRTNTNNTTTTRTTPNRSSRTVTVKRR